MGRREALAALAALFLAAAVLRPPVIAIGPLLPRIQADLDVSHALAGLLVTIPVACMGLFAPPGPWLAARLGTRAAVTLCVAAIAGFGALRAVVPGIAGVLLLTVPVGVAMGLAGPLLSVAVKERFAHRPAFTTGVYATGLVAGSSAAAVGAPLLADAAGGWRGALLVSSAITAAVAVAWLALTRGRGRGPAPVPARVSVPRLPWRRPVVWAITFAFACQGLSFYAATAWLPDIYVERGWSEDDAAALVGALLVVGLPVGIAVPWAADRLASRRLFLIPAAAGLVAASAGVAVAPGAAWLWALGLGVTLGTIFPLLLTLPLDVCDDPRDVGAASAMMLGGGYTLASVSPFALGAVRDATGSFESSAWVLTVFALLMLAATLPLSQARLRDRPAEIL